MSSFTEEEIMAIGKDMDKDHFISLKEPKRDKSEFAATPSNIPRYPTLYISDIELPFSDKDINDAGIAEIKYKLKRLTKSETNGKKRYSYDIDIMGINIKT